MDFTPQTELVPYGALVRAGLTAWQLRGNMYTKGGFWTIEFESFGYLSVEQCKEHAQKYLETAYKATDITFMRRQSHKEFQFYAQFKRGDE